MRRNRVLILFAVVFAMSAAVFWLGSVLAAAMIVTNIGLTVGESGSDTIDNTLLQADDPEVTGETLTYTLVTTPTNGSLILNGTTTLTPTGKFTQTDIDSNALSYMHNDSETLSDSFDFTVATSATTVPQTTFLITITPEFDQTPVVLDQSFSVDENSAIDTPIGTIIATDADAGDALTYTIFDGNTGSAFEVGSSDGGITVANTAPLDFETNQSITFTVEVEDMGALMDTAVITVTINDVNEAPTVDTATFSVPENSSIGTDVGTPVTSDPEDDSLTFDIVGGDPDNVFSIGSTSGQITVADNSSLDFEDQGATPHFSLTVEVDDGEFTDTATIEINVTDVNEAPTVDPATFSIPENSSIGTDVGTPVTSDPEDNSLTFDIVGGDPDNVFDIGTTSGQITVVDNSFLDFEDQGVIPHFSLTIEVDDGEFTDTATIEINVTDVNEGPTVNDNSFTINENSSNTTLVGTVTASDPDAIDVNALTFGILSGNTGGAFAITNDGSNNGRITVADSNQLDYEITQSFMLGVVVTDTGGLENTANVTININNLFDEDPVVSNATFTVAQNSNDGVVVGTVSATDPEFASGDALTFSIIGGNTGSVFAINSSNGQITVPDASKLDADAMPTFNLAVQATDKGNNIDTAIITINVTPLPITHVYLPMMLNNYPPIEPNDECSQAYGISSGRDYEFTADDIEDWYTITLTSPANLTVILSSFEPAQGQLIVYDGTNCPGPTLIANNGTPNTTEKVLNLGVRPAGRYYIRVYSTPVTNTTYTLRVNTN